jgi:hypothetical protein
MEPMIGKKFMRQESLKAVRNIIISELILAAIWVALGKLLPNGTLTAVVNIVFLLISLSLSISLMKFTQPLFKGSLAGFFSLVTAVLIWIVIFGLLRGLF